MKKANIFGTSCRRKINPEWFTGKVWMKVISEKIGAKDHDMYHVHFQKGARTKLHLHDGPQILIATSGQGSMKVYERQDAKKEFKAKRIQTITLNDGDTVYIPAKTLHTHGAVSEDKDFSHIAINIISASREYKTDWFNPLYTNGTYKKI